jgi:xanthine dehydrogenase accessory factor
MSSVRGIASDLQRWRAGGERVALPTVVATRRSAPRPVGAKLGVSAAGDMAGSVSGGCVENEVYGAAREVLAGAAPRLPTLRIADDLALEVGLPCGGEIDVFVDAPPSDLVERALETLDRDEHAVLFTVVEGDGAGSHLLVHEGGERLGNGPPELASRAEELIREGRSRLLEDAAGTVFADVIGPPPRLLVFGAVDTAEALCRAAKNLGWRTIVADARAKFASPDRIPSAGELIAAWPEETLARVQPDHATAVVVLTHDDKFDVPALSGALASDAFYIGALGSRRNQERRRGRLLEAGVDEADLDRISGPCGLDLGASTPEETALSILAEILAVRAGRSGGPLKEARGRIHTDVA